MKPLSAMVIIVAFFFLGRGVGGKSEVLTNPQTSSVSSPGTLEIPTILPARPITETDTETPAHWLTRVHFEKVREDRVTPVAKHLFGLPESLVQEIEAAMATHRQHTAALELQLAQLAQVVDEANDSVEIHIPDSPESRYELNVERWDSVAKVGGQALATRLLGDRPVFHSHHLLKRVLTVDFKRDDVTRLTATEIDGRTFNPTRSVSSREYVKEEPWLSVLERFDL